MNNQNEFLYFVNNKINFLETDSGKSRAVKAQLKKSLNMSIEESPQLWEFFYNGWGSIEKQTPSQEQVAFDVLKIYAIHTKTAVKPHTSDKTATFPRLLKAIRSQSKNPESFDNKVTNLLSNDIYAHIVRKISQLIELSSNISLDYVRLSRELLKIKYESSRQKQLFNWGQEYFTTTNTTNNSKGKDNE